MRLLTYNIREGGVGRAEQIAEVITAAKPDIVALEEAGYPEVVEDLAKRCGFSFWASERMRSAALLSNVPVKKHAWRNLPRTRHAVLEVSLDCDIRRLFVVHLRAWFANWVERQRTFELRGLLSGIKQQLEKEKKEFAFHVLAGDFNALAPGEAFDPSPMPGWIRGMVWLSGRDIARTTIDLMRSEGYSDAWRARYPDLENDPGYTFPVWNPHVRLDYVFAPAEYAGRFAGCEVRRTPDVVKSASDHFPLLVEISEKQDESSR